jgi:RimJ/RimL family protein N-acetyltransferase
VRAGALAASTPVPDLVLEGSTVTLRPLAMADAAPLALAASESRDEYTFTRVPDGADDARTYIELALAERVSGRRLPFTILWHGRIVGSTSYLDLQHWRWPPGSPLQRTEHPDVVEIGATWLAASAQRTRCNTEAKRLLLSQAFDVWRVHRVTLKTDARNQRSRRAIERLGATLDGVRRADMPAQDGTVRDSAYYSILLAEWPDVLTRLDKALAT